MPKFNCAIDLTDSGKFAHDLDNEVRAGKIAGAKSSISIPIGLNIVTFEGGSKLHLASHNPGNAQDLESAIFVVDTHSKPETKLSNRLKAFMHSNPSCKAISVVAYSDQTSAESNEKYVKCIQASIKKHGIISDAIFTVDKESIAEFVKDWIIDKSKGHLNTINKDLVEAYQECAEHTAATCGAIDAMVAVDSAIPPPRSGVTFYPT